MRRICLVLLLAAAASANAQDLLDPVRGKRIFERLISKPNPVPLRSRVFPIRATLTLSFRFQASYSIETPLKQFIGSHHTLAVLARITPDGKDPVYLGGTFRLPPVPPNEKGHELSVGGVFFLGEGSYTVELAVTDDRGRVSFHEQHFTAKLSREERHLTPMIDSGAVLPLSSLRVSKKQSADEKSLRLTLLLHAAPTYTRSVAFRPQDLGRLLGAMSGLVEQVPLKSLRVVAFNLDQQKEIFRDEHFDPASFDKLREALLPVQLGTVDYKVLQNRRGHIDLLADMLGREIRSDDPADAVVVLGPTARVQDSIRSGVIEENLPGGPRFFYFQYKSFRDHNQAQLPDTIESAIKRVGGKVFHIFGPGDFAKAITELKKVPR